MNKEVFFAVIRIKNLDDNFSRPNIAEETLRELGFRSSTANEIDLYCYCLLPVELHMLFSIAGSPGKDAGSWITAFKRTLGRRINRLFGIKLLWDRVQTLEPVKGETKIDESCNKLLDTPVREGLVDEVRDFKYCRFIKKP